ncbi:hypothetical protein BCR43DRAFT_491116 [Syncephalastrum racemosum]|uniref:Uncharacterized protein n=1 Tax=Syncephalastrum racemosum TaxID=13706 RepID=A0A1X2HBJ1_SYNRA|nr:hypothetical protein BCR43DRAFT_491116 [Syncephalastrum racemosum]
MSLSVSAAAAEPHSHHARHNNHQHHNYHNHGRQVAGRDRISAIYHRHSGDHSSLSISSLSSSSSRKSGSVMFEMFFSRLLDAIIFTSAVAITAYNYWTGSLEQPQLTAGPSFGHDTQQQHGHVDFRQWRQLHAPPRPQANHTPQSQGTLENSKRQRTLRWAETIAQQQEYNKHQYPRASAPNVPVAHAETRSYAALDPQYQRSQQRRTQSMPNIPGGSTSTSTSTSSKTASDKSSKKEKEDETLARMEERLQSLIEQGQAALSSKVELYDMDENEMAMRQAFARSK